MGGAVGDPPHAGLIVFRTAEAASAFVEADPYGEAGLVVKASDRALDGRDVVSHWERLAALPLEVEGYTLDVLRSDAEPVNGYEAANVLVTLRGGGFEGAGEDPAPVAEQRDAYVAAGPLSRPRGVVDARSFAEHS